MITKQQIPFVRILLVFIVGIVLADYFRFSYLSVYLVPTIAVFLIIPLILSKYSYRFRGLSGVLLMSAIFFTGYLVYILNSPENCPSYLEEQVGKETLKLFLIKDIQQKNKRSKCISEALGYYSSNGDYRKAKGKVLFYIDTLGLEQPLNLGDTFLVKSKIFKVKANTNPHVFDYKSYLYYRGINFQSYISKDNIKYILKAKNHSIYLITQKWRNQFHEIIKLYIKDKDQQAIASAMLLGIKNNLDASLYESFSNSGAVHVLAVSGLHVGFVAMIFYFILNLLPIRSKYYKYLKMILVVIGIFLFGMMTGMAPAIMRATIMYSIFIIAKTWRPATNNYNLLAFSAFIMLLYNPFMLFQAGFQFSYLAILGIMTFYNPIRKLIYVKSNILSYLLDMVSVSLAAQLIVFPITVYYFHKFPTYFFISGLLAIPAAAMIISLGIGLVGFHFVFPILNEIIIAPLLQLVLKILITGIAWINEWPMANIDGIFIDKPMMVFIYLIIIFTSFYKYTNQKRIIFFSLFSFLFFLIVNIYHVTSFRDNNDFIVYDSYRNSCVDFFIQDKVYNIRSDDLQDKNYKFLTFNHRLHKAINEEERLNVMEFYKDNSIHVKGGFVQIQQTLFYFSNVDKIPIYDTATKIDYLILNKTSSYELQDYLDQFDIGQIIVDHSVQKKQYYKWLKEAKELDVDIHFVQRDGVYRGELR